VGSEPDAVHALATLENSLLAGTVSKQTHDAIVAELQNQAAGGASNGKAVVKPAARKNEKPAPPPPASNTGTIAGLILGSPEFQRR
jgi:hypothetical protein